MPNEEQVTKEDITEQLGSLFVDTAATGSIETVAPAISMTGKHHLVYGSDCGVPCSTETTMENNRMSLKNVGILNSDEVESLGTRAFELFPKAAA